MASTKPNEAAKRLIEAFSAADLEAMRALLDERVTAEITNAEGGSDRVVGRENLLGRIEAMDLAAARFTVELTQEPVAVGDDRSLAMVEIHAERGDATLHNFAAHLLRITGGAVVEWQMVDAKPAESDRFWAA